MSALENGLDLLDLRLLTPLRPIFFLLILESARNYTKRRDLARQPRRRIASEYEGQRQAGDESANVRHVGHAA